VGARFQLKDLGKIEGRRKLSFDDLAHFHEKILASEDLKSPPLTEDNKQVEQK